MIEKTEYIDTEDGILGEPHRLAKMTETLGEIWHHRELLYFLVWRDIKVKYKQTALGVAWAILQPLLGMAMFTVLFGRIAKLPNDGLPYPVFYYSGLLAWTYFSTALTMASNSVAGNASLITKVYFPRMLLPAAAVVSGLLDFAIASIILLGLIIYYRVPMTLEMLFLPVILLPLLLFTLGTGLFLSALNVNYRDVRHAMPFVIQIWMFASPVVYPISMVPEAYQWVVLLNPIAGVIEIIRAILAGNIVPWEYLGISSLVIVSMLIIGIWYFRLTEHRFADVI